ncbi:DUF4426 domain-containing protein [Aliiglaciecola sp. LCG003]|uniref:DUF4426 domain-containing protein n=1 Tax=Aliiglaciecola sp. LCG003 TaxID=3053655 RepID=UPI0025737D0B|nr:DUF4426 domain-containing protein [Aliiglaciecola sp. LCG003]WJG08669.1 DUF4426 domain-containing protein [Aliiglaciecola sp. LCG003]
MNRRTTHKVALFSRTLALAFMITSLFTQAEQKKVLGDWDVHYIAFASTILTPAIAKQNNIRRSPNNTIINISVLDRKTQKAQKVNIQGSARNLLGRGIELEFFQVIEGDAIYYLAVMPFDDEEHYRFKIDLSQGKKNQQLIFEQKLYQD